VSFPSGPLGYAAPMLLWRALPMVVVAVSLLACSGSQAAPVGAPTSTTSSTAGDASAAEVCLAAASAKREKRADEPSRVSVKHVLVQHAFSKKGRDSIKRSREEACLRAAEARDKLRGGADFAEIVSAYSDEPGAASRGGSIGAVERADLVPAFSDAAFELEVHQLSDVVETEFGFHVIVRTE
jgi:peptidyl-prolyl cis-trans isomerase NIMA-interacting 1